MTQPGEIDAAERRGYSRGYAAGRKRKTKEIGETARWERKSAFWRQAMLAALPFAMTQSIWKKGDVPINSVAERMKLAADVADAALEQAERLARI